MFIFKSLIEKDVFHVDRKMCHIQEGVGVGLREREREREREKRERERERERERNIEQLFYQLPQRSPSIVHPRLEQGLAERISLQNQAPEVAEVQYNSHK